MAFTFLPLGIPEVVLITPRVFEDPRGAFLETYRQSEFAANGLPQLFVQDNFSWSRHGVIRGLHFQKNPAAQGKLVSVPFGEILDVAVDIRKGSPTFGQWVSATLSAQNRQLLYVPEGFAHGFCVLSEQAGVSYKVTAEYSAAHDRGIRWNDPQIGVAWPASEPIVSAKDAAQPLLAEADSNFVYSAPG